MQTLLGRLDRESQEVWPLGKKHKGNPPMCSMPYGIIDHKVEKEQTVGFSENKSESQNTPRNVFLL